MGTAHPIFRSRQEPELTKHVDVDNIVILSNTSIASELEPDMAEYILFMHDDAIADESSWEPYIRKLQQSGCFEGGSAIGDGVCTRKSGAPASVTTHLTGYIRVQAESLDQAKSMLAGNPHFEAGGTVEIRELPRTD